MSIELLPMLLEFRRPPGTHELADRAGIEIYACPAMTALLSVRGCEANRERFRRARAARDEIAERSVAECAGCPGVVALARGRTAREQRRRSDTVTAVEAAAMLGWADPKSAGSKLRASGVHPVGVSRLASSTNGARRNLYARADVERLVADRSRPRDPRARPAQQKMLERRQREREKALASLRPHEILTDEIVKLLGDRASAARGISTILIRAGVKPVRQIPWAHAANGKRWVYPRAAVMAFIEKRNARRGALV
jgi:hypothetical protein